MTTSPRERSTPSRAAGPRRLHRRGFRRSAREQVESSSAKERPKFVACPRAPHQLETRRDTTRSRQATRDPTRGVLEHALAPHGCRGCMREGRADSTLHWPLRQVRQVRGRALRQAHHLDGSTLNARRGGEAPLAGAVAQSPVTPSPRSSASAESVRDWPGGTATATLPPGSPASSIAVIETQGRPASGLTMRSRLAWARLKRAARRAPPSTRTTGSCGRASCRGLRRCPLECHRARTAFVAARPGQLTQAPGTARPVPRTCRSR